MWPSFQVILSTFSKHNLTLKTKMGVLAVQSEELRGKNYPLNISFEQYFDHGVRFLTVQESSTHLTHRQASREGDITIIWSLLTQDTPFYTATGFWEFLINTETLVSTGFLFTSVRRVPNRRGLGWAPAYPSVHCSGNASLVKDSKSYAGAFTPQGKPTDQGYSAPWATYTFECGSNETLARLNPEVQEIATRYLNGYSKGILLRVLNNYHLPYSEEEPTAYMLGTNPEPLYTAVCGSHDGDAWEWKGFHHWRRIDQLPTSWQKLTVLLV